ncbi:MAG: hypothetical protein A2W22_07045 [Candidatus Levybacteria bacterium RBG_16_35_11]|nr:MAG: hypothetical protein A2W22_07045 [Candidatus Levybacteria bacterium RBG_16_35_11]
MAKEKLDLTGFEPREWTQDEWLDTPPEERDLYNAKLKQFREEKQEAEEKALKMKWGRETLEGALRTYIRYGGRPPTEEHKIDGKKRKLKFLTIEEILETIADKLATTKPEKITITDDDVINFLNRKKTSATGKLLMLDEENNKKKHEVEEMF